jgi:hypothetical protein
LLHPQGVPRSSLNSPSAAWIGAIATASWRARNRTLRGKIATALAVAGAAVLGWILRGHVNFLDLEHVVAFGIGVDVAVRLSGIASTRRVELGAAGA